MKTWILGILGLILAFVAGITLQFMHPVLGLKTMLPTPQANAPIESFLEPIPKFVSQTSNSLILKKTTFAELSNWVTSDPRTSLKAFQISCRSFLKMKPSQRQCEAKNLDIVLLFV